MGLKVPPPIFIFENNKKVIRLCTVLNFGSFEDRAIFRFHVSQLSYGGGPYVPITDRYTLYTL